MDVIVRGEYLARVRCQRYGNRGEGTFGNYIPGSVCVKALLIIGYGILGHLDSDKNGRWGSFLDGNQERLLTKGKDSDRILS